MSDWNYDEHIILTDEEQRVALGMCVHGYWLHEHCDECESDAVQEQVERRWD